ncbi:MAG TPA: gene transfer agent family protein [Beijerinckiaceae bacterium]|nr:gene transfer agent family protein [Beijerinckiaceae bacterium]
MSRLDTSRTAIDADFAGRRRRFQLRIGEIGELERLCGAGIGEIALRLQLHTFRAADVWEPIRLGLEGGGAGETEATALVVRYQSQPIADYIGLAARIVDAALSGAPKPDAKAARPGKAMAEGVPATSPPSTSPEA